MNHTVIFDGKTEDFIANNPLEKFNATYTNVTLGRWGEAFTGDNGGEYIYVTSEGDRTVAILIPNACDEETAEILNGFVFEAEQKSSTMIKKATQQERFSDFISNFNKEIHFLYAKEELVSADIAETIFLYGLKGTEFKIVNIEDRKILNQTTN